MRITCFLTSPLIGNGYRRLNLLKDLNLPLLTVRIYMKGYPPNYDGPRSFHAGSTQEQRVKLVQTYRRIVKPLSSFRGLARFFIHISWPFDWTPEGRRARYRDPEKQKYGIKTLEHHLEQSVMGSDYDSSALNKNELQVSQWLEQYKNWSWYFWSIWLDENYWYRITFGSRRFTLSSNSKLQRYYIQQMKSPRLSIFEHQSTPLVWISQLGRFLLITIYTRDLPHASASVAWSWCSKLSQIIMLSKRIWIVLDDIVK